MKTDHTTPSNIPSCIWIVSPSGYLHSHAFDYIALGLQKAFWELGRDIPIVTDPARITGRALVLGANLLAGVNPVLLPKDLIIFNLEQIDPDSPWITKEYIALMKSFPIWDYSFENVTKLKGFRIENVQVCEIGYHEAVTRISKEIEDIDILFYGSLNERRKKLLATLTERGLLVVHLFGVYGEKLDRHIERAKVVLNIHFFESKVFEIVRVSYLLANKKCVLSETGSDKEVEKRFEGGVVFAPYEELADTALRLCSDSAEREQRAEVGHEIFKQYSQTDYVRKAVAQCL